MINRRPFATKFTAQIKILILVLLSGCIFLQLGTVYGARADLNKEWKLWAGNAIYDDVKKSYFFSDGVTINRGSMELHSNNLRLDVNATGDKFLVARAFIIKNNIVKSTKDQQNSSAQTQYNNCSSAEKNAALNQNCPTKLVFFRQKTDNHNEFIEAYGEIIEYDSAKELLKIIGMAKLQRLVGTKVLDEVRGELITHDGLRGLYYTQGAAIDKIGENRQERAYITIAPRK